MFFFRISSFNLISSLITDHVVQIVKAIKNVVSSNLKRRLKLVALAVANSFEKHSFSHDTLPQAYIILE